MSRSPDPDSLTWKKRVVCHWQNQQLLTDPGCAPESAKSVSTSRTGSHARDGVVTPRENPSKYYHFLGFIAWLNLPIPHDELRVATNA